MEYIHDMRPSSGLLPASVEDRAKVRMVTEMVASGIQPYQVRPTVKQNQPPKPLNSFKNAAMLPRA